MMKLILLSGMLCVACLAHAQRYLYREIHKEQKFYFVLGDSASLSDLDDLERIRYEGHYKRCAFTKQILPGYSEEFECVIDSDDHVESWMQLARRFVFNSVGTAAYYADGRQIYFKALDSAQLADKALQAKHIENNGIHPGIAMFPQFTATAIEVMKQQGISVTQTLEGVNIKMNDVYITFDAYRKRIIREYLNDAGENMKEITWYQTLNNQQGLVPVMYRKERSFSSVKGHCLTEVNLILYSDFDIDDPAKLIEKSLQSAGWISVFPNPGDGKFQVQTEIGSDVLSWIRLVNVQTGSVYQPDLPTTSSFELNVTNLPAGQYTLQVGTIMGKVLSCSIIKR